MTTRTITQDDIDAFGVLSGGTGLIHTEPDYAASTRFGATLVQGIFLAALVQQELPPGWTALELQFVAPVRVGTPIEIVLGSDRGGLAIEVRTPDGPAVLGSAARAG
ncbi:MaoC/PaaZ C-terminal domain-containing protein [Pseudonocardia sp. KRD291]|uniref:MaoC/PaaZ C-terminal domain-containing protein n=1 Tax=Pseudonocardia sp. KRD291 TaxID=2792007 RepID=UPI001C4A30E4|nr:MaoC/PaaZ C-terminal domain-containing protein [Pseudonocardia sp. KRD291]MBW0105972.1 hypothetical protein [Pseudonocardia sp. KRD291]